MNNSQIDYLLQVPVPAPRPEAGSSQVRPSDDAPAFDDHIRRASDSGSPTSSAPNFPSLQARSDREDQRRATRDDDRPARPAAQSDSQSAGKSESSTEAAPATEDSAAKQDDHDRDEVPTDESAEVAALLAAAEQAQAEVATSAKPGKPSSDELAAVARVRSTGQSQPEATNANDAKSAKQGQAAPAADAKSVAHTTKAEGLPGGTELPVDAPALNPDQSAAEKQRAAVATQAAAVDVATPIAETEAELTDKGQSTKQTSKQTSAAQQQAAARNSPEKHSQVDSATAASTGVIAKPADSQAAVDDAGEAKKGDKKISHRAATATIDATSSSSDRPAVTATADAAVNLPASTSAQPQVSDVATPALSTESTASAKDTTAGTKNDLLSPFSRLERSSAQGMRGGQRAGRSDGGPPVDPARFVSRVARAVQIAQGRGGPLQLRLSPPELGAMRIELSLHQGTLTAKVETDNQTAKQVLLDNLPALRDRLADQNVKIERFDVDVRRDPTGGQQNSGPQDRGAEHRHQRNPNRPAAGLRNAAAAAVDEAIAIRRTITNASINVVA